MDGIIKIIDTFLSKNINIPKTNNKRNVANSQKNITLGAFFNDSKKDCFSLKIASVYKLV